jgi:DNA gyrase subunit A
VFELCECARETGAALDGSSSADKEYVLAVSARGFGKRIATKDFRTTARGGVGVIALKFKKSSAEKDEMTCLRAVKDTDEILVITAKGIMVRQKVSMISSQSRTATGVLIQKLDEGDHISSVSIVPEYEESDLS